MRSTEEITQRATQPRGEGGRKKLEQGNPLSKGTQPFLFLAEKSPFSPKVENSVRTCTLKM